MAAERFQTLSEQEIAELLTEKTARIHRKQLKDAICRLLFEEHLKQKHIHSCPETANKLATVLKKLYAEVKKKDGNISQLECGEVIVLYYNSSTFAI